MTSDGNTPADPARSLSPRMLQRRRQMYEDIAKLRKIEEAISEIGEYLKETGSD